LFTGPLQRRLYFCRFMYDLNNKVVLVSGASGGIGKAIATEALKRGASVSVCGRSLEKLEKVFPARERLFLFQADVSVEADCSSWIAATVAKWGRVDVLINNAGQSMRALFEYTELSVLKQLMDVNFWGAVYSTKYALPYIKRQKGIIAGVSSIAGYRGLPGRTGYSASKFALQGFLEALRTELLHTGTHVMWISPGFTASNIRNVALAADGSAQKETPLDESKLMTAEQCAVLLLNALEQRKRSLVMTRQGKLTVWLNKLIPGLADKLVFRHFLKEPDSPLAGYK